MAKRMSQDRGETTDSIDALHLLDDLLPPILDGVRDGSEIISTVAPSVHLFDILRCSVSMVEVIVVRDHVDGMCNESEVDGARPDRVTLHIIRNKLDSMLGQEFVRI